MLGSDFADLRGNGTDPGADASPLKWSNQNSNGVTNQNSNGVANYFAKHAISDHTIPNCKADDIFTHSQADVESHSLSNSEPNSEPNI